MTIYTSLVYNFNKLLENKTKNNICVVFDIDGTIINDNVYSPKSERDIIIDVYKFLMSLQHVGVPIFIITARPDFTVNRNATSRMLDDLGIDYEYLYMWNRQVFDDHISFKEEARYDIHLHGYDVIMSLGDNEWDYGKYGGLGVHIYNNGESIEYFPEQI